MPSVSNAPGLTWKPRKNGLEARWQARTDLVKDGYSPKSAQLWKGAETELTETVIAYLQDRCNALQKDMLDWSRSTMLPVVGAFDHTVKGLVNAYQTDPDSNFGKLRHCTRVYYASLCRRINTDMGDTAIADLKARDMLRWHESLIVPDGPGKPIKTSQGHACMTMLRTLLGFGMTILEDEDCTRLSTILHKMRFPVAKPRSERLTAEQVIAVRAKAHANGKPSMALAQAIQFEVILRQKDVIGEWVPRNEAIPSDIFDAGSKWVRGLRWSEIDSNLILKHITSKRQKPIEVNLFNAPMVMEELKLLDHIPAGGPVIVSELTKLPYRADEFRRQWRKLANECGIPKSVRNMDSRAGAISEATDAGADLEHVRHAATHSDIGMTQRYSRGDVEKTANVQRARSAHRIKNEK